MATKKLKSIKGRALRITRLDECGNPVYGACSVVVTHGFISVELSSEVEAGDEYTQKNAYGELCISEKDPDITKWVNVSISLCEVDPNTLDIVGGATPIVVSGDTIGAAFGQNAPTGAYAIEVWTKKAGLDACAAGTPEWGYFAVPFIKNGRIDGSVKIENAAMNLSMVGQGYPVPSAWGIGPHGDNPLKILTGFPAGDLWAMVVTDVQPPAPTTGCAALVEPPVKGAVDPGDVFPAEATVTAEDATNAAKLAGLGYVDAPPTTAWASGEYFTVGTFKFNWTGAAWAAGAHA